MTTPQHDDDVAVQLAAYLAGELDGDAADALQDRIDSEPWVARLADEIAAALVALGGVDDVEPPEGFSTRLQQRLAAEIGHDLPRVPPGDGPGRPGTPAPAPTAAGHGSRRPSGREDRGARSTRRRLRPGLVAAVVALLAVVGVGSLVTSGVDDASDSAFQGADVALDQGEEGRTSDTVEEESATQTMEAAPMADAAADEAGSAAMDSAASTAPADSLAATGPVQEGPVTLTLGEVSGDGDQAIVDLLVRLPAVDALRGRAQADAAELTLVYRDEILRGPDFDDGTPAGQCLSEVLRQAGEDLVPAVAARLDLPEGPTVAYSLVRSRGGDTLDAVDVWLIDPASCMVLRVVSGP